MKVLLLLVFLVGNLFAAENVIFSNINDTWGLVGEITELTQEDFARKVMTHKLPYMKVYIDSPGGDVLAIARMLEIMDTSNINFICVARFAASAAFIFFENCNHRLLMPKGGILMSHNASGMLMGTLPQMRQQLDAIEAIVEQLERKTAKRLKMTYAAYHQLIANDLWLTIDNAGKYNAIDGITQKVACTTKLVEETITKRTLKCSFFGCTLSKNKYSACPLLTIPLGKEEK